MLDRTRIVQVSANHASDAPRVMILLYESLNKDVDRVTSERVTDYCYGQEKLLLLLFRFQV
jgi:hypothetical protein